MAGLGLSAAVCSFGVEQAAPAASAGRPKDVAGWRAARWGMREPALRDAFQGRLTELTGRWQYGGAYADQALTDIELAGLAFMAFFQMNEHDDGLQQVLLECRRTGSTPINFDRVLTDLVQRYGAPDRICNARRSSRGTLALEAIWRFPTTSIHLSFVDFSSTGVLSRRSDAPIDPLVPDRATRLFSRRSVPRRILLRYRPSDRIDLDTPLDCPETGIPAHRE